MFKLSVEGTFCNLFQLGMHRSDICIGIGTDIEDISRSGIGDKWADPYFKKIYIYIFFLRLCTYLNPIPTTLLL